MVASIEMGGAEMAEGPIMGRQPVGRAGQERLVCSSGFGSQPQEGDGGQLRRCSGWILWGREKAIEREGGGKVSGGLWLAGRGEPPGKKKMI
ncbi:hypothetical protein Peur_058351 [Populus x canadensis]